MICDVFAFSDNYLLGKTNEQSVPYVTKKLFSLGAKIGRSLSFGSDADSAKPFLKKSENQEKINVIFIDEKFELVKNLTKILCEETECGEKIFPDAKTHVEEYFRQQNLPLPKDIESLWSLPAKAKLILNPFSLVQGFSLVSNLTTYWVLPIKFFDAKKILDEILLPSLADRLSSKYKTQTFKTFGISDEEIKKAIPDLIKNKEKISISTFKNGAEVDIVLKAFDSNPALSDFSQVVFDRLSRFIFAEEDISLENTVFELLKRNDLTLSIAETVTGGAVSSALTRNNSEIFSVLKESVVAPSNEALSSLLSVSKQTLLSFGLVSVETTYEIASGLLTHGLADIVISSTGFVESGIGSKKGLCYVAVGDKKAIHVYKNHFVGERDELIDQMTKATYFYLAKKLRQNDFHFEKNTL